MMEMYGVVFLDYKTPTYVPEPAYPSGGLVDYLLLSMLGMMVFWPTFCRGTLVHLSGTALREATTVQMETKRNDGGTMMCWTSKLTFLMPFFHGEQPPSFPLGG